MYMARILTSRKTNIIINTLIFILKKITLLSKKNYYTFFFCINLRQRQILNFEKIEHYNIFLHDTMMSFNQMIWIRGLLKNDNNILDCGFQLNITNSMILSKNGNNIFLHDEFKLNDAVKLF